jgi:hypothetical protein
VNTPKIRILSQFNGNSVPMNTPVVVYDVRTVR